MEIRKVGLAVLHQRCPYCDERIKAGEALWSHERVLLNGHADCVRMEAEKPMLIHDEVAPPAPLDPNMWSAHSLKKAWDADIILSIKKRRENLPRKAVVFNINSIFDTVVPQVNPDPLLLNALSTPKTCPHFPAKLIMTLRLPDSHRPGHNARHEAGDKEFNRIIEQTWKDYAAQEFLKYRRKLHTMPSCSVHVSDPSIDLEYTLTIDGPFDRSMWWVCKG